MVDIQIRPYRTGDAERITDIIQRCLVDVNYRDYPPQIIGKLRAYYSVDRFTEISNSRRIYVAETDRVLGTVSREGNKVYTMFVDPNYFGNGIGCQLMEYVERLAAEEGYNNMETGASIAAHDFYIRLGYSDLRESEADFGLIYIMRKPLR
jgi:GNAT superfamily N-acetyltransferase